MTQAAVLPSLAVARHTHSRLPPTQHCAAAVDDSQLPGRSISLNIYIYLPAGPERASMRVGDALLATPPPGHFYGASGALALLFLVDISGRSNVGAERRRKFGISSGMKHKLPVPFGPCVRSPSCSLCLTSKPTQAFLWRHSYL